MDKLSDHGDEMDKFIAKAPSRSISEFDTMLDAGQEDTYFETGRLALEICLRALKRHKPERILDFPCGFGRVLRWFRAQWPEAEIYGDLPPNFHPAATRVSAMVTPFGAG